MSPVDEWTEAARELLETSIEVRAGKQQIVTIGKKKYSALASAIDLNNVPQEGGWDFGGSYTLQIPLASFKVELPEKGEYVIFQGNSIRIYSVNTINAMVEILVANLSS